MLAAAPHPVEPLAAEDTLSLVERAYRRLRDAIVQGALAARSRISERSLAASLGISAQPVREALRRLEQDGMVVTLPRRGTVVAEFGPARQAEMGRIRAALEGAAAALAGHTGILAALDARAPDLAEARMRAHVLCSLEVGGLLPPRADKESKRMTLPLDRLRAALTGISGILVTPMDAEDRIAPARLAPIIARAAAAGVDALTVNGNTGEFYGLSFAEAERMQAEVPALVAGRAAVVAGIGRSVQEACALARRAKADGADAVMVHQPPDPFVAPRGVVAYVAKIAEAAGLPVVLYLRNDGIGLPAIDSLCRVPGVIGVKWATPNVMVLAQAIRRAGPEVSFICGLAEPWAPPMTALGAQGFTSGLINLVPERSVAILRALRAGDFARANAEIAAIHAFEALRAEEQNGANVAVVKAALTLSGIDVGAARPPAAWPLPPGSAAALRDLLAGWGLLPRAAAG